MNSDATVTKYGRNYETNGRLYAFDARRQGQLFHNYTALDIINYLYHFFLLILLLLLYNCGFSLLNFSCMGMLPKTLGQNNNASNFITEIPIVSVIQKNYHGSAFLHLTLFVVLTNVKQFYFMKHLPDMCNIWCFLNREHDQIYLILTQYIVIIL